MTPRPFIAGDEGEIRGGVRYRICQGRKGPTDLVLEVRGPSFYSPLSMDLGFLMADFFKQNEDRLYPPGYHFRGGSMYLDAVLQSARNGWVPTLQKLRADQEARRKRDRVA